MIRAAVVGAGLIGTQRLAAIGAMEQNGLPVEVVGWTDPASPDAVTFSRRFADLEALLAKHPNWVLVATPHDVAAGLAERALRTGASVLIEKPLGRNLREADRLLTIPGARQRLWVGLNYRHFAGVDALLQDVTSGGFGELLSLEIVLGHGGSPTDRESWKLDPERCGGGVLLDPGVHVLDLVRLIGGDDVAPVYVRSWAGFWNTGIEEEAHVHLTSSRLPLITVRMSIVNWRSTFRIELTGTEGYGIVEGRGRSYGPQTYRRGRRWGWLDGGTQLGSEEEVVVSPCEDALSEELKVLWALSSESKAAACPAAEARETMQLLDQVRDLNVLVRTVRSS